MLSGMQTKRPKRPRDPNQLGRLIVALSVGEEQETTPDAGKNPDAVALGKRGGEARAKSLSSKKRKEIAQRAAAKRWGKK